MKIRDYMEWKNIKDPEAAKELGVTVRRIQQLKAGGPAGRLLGRKIVEWSGGAVSLEEALFPANNAA